MAGDSAGVGRKPAKWPLSGVKAASKRACQSLRASSHAVGSYAWGVRVCVWGGDEVCGGRRSTAHFQCVWRRQLPPIALPLRTCSKTIWAAAAASPAVVLVTQ